MHVAGHAWLSRLLLWGRSEGLALTSTRHDALKQIGRAVADIWGRLLRGSAVRRLGGTTTLLQFVSKTGNLLLVLFLHVQVGLVEMVDFRTDVIHFCDLLGYWAWSAEGGATPRHTEMHGHTVMLVFVRTAGLLFKFDADLFEQLGQAIAGLSAGGHSSMSVIHADESTLLPDCEGRGPLGSVCLTARRRPVNRVLFWRAFSRSGNVRWEMWRWRKNPNEAIRV